MQAIVDTIASFLQAVLSFISPVVVFFISVGSIVAFLLGALADPQGLMNRVVCGAIDMISGVFPSTPDNLKIGSIIESAGSVMPAFGTGLIREVLGTIAGMAAIALVIKIYKLMPFKMS